MNELLKQLLAVIGERPATIMVISLDGHRPARKALPRPIVETTGESCDVIPIGRAS